MSGTVKPFTLDAGKSREEQNKDASKLRGFSDKHRSSVEHLVDARNAMESSGTEKDREKYEKKRTELDGAMSGKGIEERIPIESYKQAVLSQIGPELDAGAAVVVQLSGHYVRLQAIHEDHVIVDDPARHARANRKLTWAEARAMGYFYHRLVLNG